MHLRRRMPAHRINAAAALILFGLLGGACPGCVEDCVRRCDHEYGECVKSGEHPDVCAAQRSACEQSCSDFGEDGLAGRASDVR